MMDSGSKQKNSMLCKTNAYVESPELTILKKMEAGE